MGPGGTFPGPASYRPAAPRGQDVAPLWRLERQVLGIVEGPLPGLGFRVGLGFGRRALSLAPCLDATVRATAASRPLRPAYAAAPGRRGDRPRNKGVQGTGMVGLPSVLVRGCSPRARRACGRALCAARPHALGGSCDGWLLLVVVEVKPRLCIYIENPTSAPNQSIQEEFRMARTLLYDPGMVGLPSVLVRTPKARA